MKHSNLPNREPQRRQSTPEELSEAVSRMNDDPINIFGGTAYVPEKQLEAERKERLRLYRELFPDKYTLLGEAEKRKIEELIGP